MTIEGLVANSQASEPETILEARALTKRYRSGGAFGRGHEIIAVKNVSLAIHAGESVGLVGESGSGKTTLGRLLVRLEEPTDGAIFFRGQDITHKQQADLAPVRRQMQIVFQDPFSALNPWMSIGDAIGEPIWLRRGLRGEAVTREIDRLLDIVGLPSSAKDRMPKEFSGGQRQRICLARALALEPQLLVLDEPTSALDVSVQAQILNLLRDMRQELGLTYLFISHDLAVVAYLCSRICVMRYGEILEMASREQFISQPTNPYTLALRNAVPEVGRPLPEDDDTGLVSVASPVSNAALGGELPPRQALTS